MNNTTTALKSTPKLACALSFAILSAPAMAAITYVDAAEGASGNAFATGGSLAVTNWRDTTSTGGIEDQWERRAFANETTVFQALHEVVTSDEMPQLTTEITALADGTYTMWAFYWDQVTSSSQNWTLSTGLTSGALASYSSPGHPAIVGASTTGVSTTGVSSATTLSFTTAVQTVDTVNREMFGVNLGNVTVSGGSTVNVYVDNLIGNGSLNRTWYDGVGYELAPVPEPSSLALFGLAGAGLLLRRRRS
ncbi:MAG: hypothetical protein ACJAVK_001410 [Akkermansiaceae bacterium]|jgi:hypothetical protein